MATTYLDRYSDAVTLHEAVTGPTSAPDGDTTRYVNRKSENVATYLRYAGDASGTLTLHIYDGETWYTGASQLFDSANGNEALDWTIGERRMFTFRVASISGGGSVTVRLEAL